MSNAETVQDTPLTIREHLDPDKHWIGETLAPPTQSEIAATVGSTSSPGDSPFVARADHAHRLDTGLYFQYAYYQFPSVVNATTSSTTMTTWFTTAAFTVPTWATYAYIDVMMAGAYMVTDAASTNYYFDARFTGDAYGSAVSIFQGSAINIRSFLHIRSQVAITSSGSRTISVGAYRPAGTGVLRADTATWAHTLVFYKPVA